MRKKLLSLLTVLCLVLGMLPATAMAADTVADLGYSEEDIAMTISEDTELTEDVEGLVLVVAPVNVTVKGAKLATGLVVAETAKGATVVLGEDADVNAVIVMGAAEVVVEETAAAAYITVAAAETTVTVAGTVESVTVAEAAEKTVVTVAETGKVEKVEVAAPAVELVVEENAAVAEVTDKSGELTVSGAGAEAVTVTTPDEGDADEDKEDEEKKDEDEEDEEKKDEDKEDEEKKDEEKPADTTPAPVVTGNLGLDTGVKSHVAAPDLKVAPLEDHSEDAETNLVSKYDLTVVAGEGTNDFDVVITAWNLKEHENSAHTPAHWVGLAIPNPTDGRYAFYTYKITNGVENTANPAETAGDLGIEWGTDYKTMYFGFTSIEKTTTTQWRVEVVKIAAGSGPVPVRGTAEAEYVLNVSFNITFEEIEAAKNAEAAGLAMQSYIEKTST